MIATTVLSVVLGCTDRTDIKSPIETIWTDPDRRGPYDVGLATIEFTDDRGKELNVDIWYPAAAETGDELAQYTPLALSITALREPQPAVKNAPVLAFSHGFGAIRFQSAFLLEHLASHGYVSVASDHNHNTFMDLDDQQTPTVLFERPDDIRSAVDELFRLSRTEHALWADLVEPSRYAALGHSFGSHTAMALGGAELDYEGLINYCEATPSTRACRYLDGVNPEAAVGHGAVDERVVLTIPMSPGLWYTFGADGTGLESSVPALLMAGTLDSVLDYLPEAIPTFESHSRPVTLASFAGAGHYGFTDICVLASFLTPECEAELAENGEPYADIEEIKQQTITLVTAFLGARYLEDERFEPWLTPDHWTNSLVTLSDRE